MAGQRITIVGGAGFIGHNMALDFARRGAHVDVVDSLQINNLLYFATARGSGPAPKRDMDMLNERVDLLREADIPLHPQDARDYHAMSRLLNEIKPDVLIHLAAIAHANKANKDPYSTFDHSLRTLENSLDWARGGRVKQFIYFSSSMAYGNFSAPSVTEEHPLDPLGIYGALKMAGEKIVQAYGQTFGLPHTIIRPSALYGERCVSRRVVQVFIESALAGEDLKIAGDGEERLDFTYIDDLVQGVRLAIGNERALGEVFNITHGDGRSLNELAAIVQKEFPGVGIQYVDRDKMMPFRGTLDIGKARKVLGYEPTHPIEHGVPKYAQWYRTAHPTTPRRP